MYYLHVDYTCLGKCNRPNIKSNISKDNCRLQGYRNNDLWTNKKLYPIDPLKNSTPPFKDITSFLLFVGDGGYGALLAYTQSFQVQNDLVKVEQNLMEGENFHL